MRMSMRRFTRLTNGFKEGREPRCRRRAALHVRRLRAAVPADPGDGRRHRGPYLDLRRDHRAARLAGYPPTIMLAALKARLPPLLLGLLRQGRGKFRAIRIYPVLQRSPLKALRYVLFDREIDNFTYDITNRAEIARLLAAALGSSEAIIGGYIDELDADEELRASIELALARRRGRNRTMPYGRRVGWYAAVRLTKPKIAVETGVHDGLGSAVLLRALARNSTEDHDGTLVAFDIRDDVAWLVPPWLRSRYELRMAIPRTNLGQAMAGRPVDLFIHDSDHRYEHETAEFAAILPLAAPGAVLMSDNSHGSSAFKDFCERHGLGFTFIPERPADHFYPGAGIGLAVLPDERHSN